MGTSTPFGGGKNGDPLRPSWLPGDGADQGDGNQGGGDQGAPGNDGPPGGGGGDDAPEPAQTAEYTRARKLFNRHMRHGAGGVGGGGGGRTPLQRAVGGYVANAAGGSKAAASRMVTSRGAAASLGRLLFDASTNGIREVVRRLNLDALATRSLREIYASLVDFIAGEGGATEDAINRDAYLEAVDEIADMPDVDLEHPNVETINLLIERFIAGTINDRIKQAIATQVVVVPQTVAASQAAQQEVRDFVLGRVQDAMAEVGRIFRLDHIQPTIDKIYERALAILQTYADDEQ
jgi:hypothetical protein